MMVQGIGLDVAAMYEHGGNDLRHACASVHQCAGYGIHPQPFLHLWAWSIYPPLPQQSPYFLNYAWRTLQQDGSAVVWYVPQTGGMVGLQGIGTHEVQYEASLYLAYAGTTQCPDVFIQGLHHRVVVGLQDDVPFQCASFQCARNHHPFVIFVVCTKSFQSRNGGKQF